MMLFISVCSKVTLLVLGEKPYKCEFCDYAAAQKTSLRYHLERHHKDKQTDAAADGKSDGRPQEAEDALLTADSAQTKNLKRCFDGAKDVKGSPPAKQLKGMAPASQSVLGGALLAAVHREPQDLSGDAVDDGAEKPSKAPGPAYLDALKKRPPADPQASPLVCRTEAATAARHAQLGPPEKRAADAGCQEKPLNLSLGAPHGGAGAPLGRSVTASSTCPFCTFKTFYPEVLTMHQRLEHKYHPDAHKSCRGRAALRSRRTGCPPALLGKDVPPLPGAFRPKPRPAAPAQPKPAPAERPAPGAQGPSRAPPPAGADSTLAPSNLKALRPLPPPGLGVPGPGPARTPPEAPPCKAGLEKARRPEPQPAADTTRSDGPWAPARDYACGRGGAEPGEPLPKRPRVAPEPPCAPCRRPPELPQYRVVRGLASLLPPECACAPPAPPARPRPAPGPAFAALLPCAPAAAAALEGGRPRGTLGGQGEGPGAAAPFPAPPGLGRGQRGPGAVPPCSAEPGVLDA